LLNKLATIERQKNALQKLNEIASISNQSPKETLRQALEVGKEHFGLEFAIVSHIVGEEYTVEVQSSPPDTLFDGQLFPLGVTYCKTTLEIDDVLAIRDVVNSKYAGHPCHSEFKLVSYIGAPVVVNSKVYGTINFSSPSAYHVEYDETDIEFMRLLARWAGSFLERQFVLDALVESEKKFRMMANSVPVLIWIAGLDKSCYFYNNFSGDTMGEEAGTGWSKGVHPDDFENCRDIYYDAFDAKKEFTMEYRRYHRGSYNWVLDNGVPRYDENGEFAGFIGVCIDISARKAVEKALEESESRLRGAVEKEREMLIQQSKMAMMGEMIGAIAHQWRQPLNSLALIIQDVLHAHMFEELNEEYLLKFKNDAMNTIRSMSNTIDDFKNFFSPDKKQEQFFLEDAMNETLQMLSAQYKVNSIDVIFDTDILNKHSYICFKNELKQVFLNILANAKDAIVERKPKNRFVKIAIAKIDDFDEITIEDSANGIPEEIIGNIFDSYFTTKQDTNGTGIGLYMSKEIVEKHFSGKLDVENTDNGAKFIIRLPKQ